MKPDQTGVRSAAPARHGRLADFIFVGVGVLPVVLLLGGFPGIGLLLFIPLLLAACLYGMWEQIASGSVHSGGDGEAGERFGGKPPAAGISLREKL